MENENKGEVFEMKEAVSVPDFKNCTVTMDG